MCQLLMPSLLQIWARHASMCQSNFPFSQHYCLLWEKITYLQCFCWDMCWKKGLIEAHFSEILIGSQIFLLNKMHLKMSSGKWRPSCLGLIVSYELSHDKTTDQDGFKTWNKSSIWLFWWGKSTAHCWFPLTKGQLCQAMMFSLIYTWTNGWTNSGIGSDLRYHESPVTWV